MKIPIYSQIIERKTIEELEKAVNCIEGALNDSMVAEQVTVNIAFANYRNYRKWASKYIPIEKIYSFHKKARELQRIWYERTLIKAGI